MSIYLRIGKNIRRMRTSRRPFLSIHRLGVAADVDPGQLSRAERGMSGLSIQAMDRLANALDVGIETLISGEKKPQSVSSHGVAEPASDDYITHDTPEIRMERLAEQALTELLRKNHADHALEIAERGLCFQQLSSAIQEGLMRGRIQVEREIQSMMENKSQK